MEHLATLDAAFGALDDEHSALNIASLGVFEGPTLDVRELTALIRRKLHLVPRLRQVLRPVPFGLARPAWVDDDAFDLHHHVRNIELAAPAGIVELEQVMAGFVSAPLDPSRPLWQVLLIDGLADGRWALATKLHHSVVDGVGGLALISRLLDTTPDAPLPPPATWQPERVPSKTAMLRSAIRVQAHAVRAAVGGVVRVGVRPSRVVHEVTLAAGGLNALRAGLRRTAPSSLSGPLGSARTYLTGRIALADIDGVRKGLGGTVNDVALALVTAAQRRVIVDRGEQVLPHQVHCLVPVSLRGHRPADPAGNRVSALIIDLPVEFGDPFARYEAVLARVRHAKHAHAAQVGAGLELALDALPAPLVSAAVHASAAVPQNFLTTVVTNVPGSAGRLYALGRPLVEHFPYVPIADRVRTGMALTSYDDQIFYGITADADSMPDAGTLRDAITQELTTLTEISLAAGSAHE